MKTRRLYLRTGLAVLAAALLIYYCKNCVGHAAQASGYVGDRYADTLNIRIDAAANVLNPYITTSAYPRYVSSQVFQTLGALDPESFELKPLICKAIPKARTITDGPYQGSLAYDFEILPEAAWDNGTPVTGYDLVFTYKIQLHPLLPLHNFSGYIEDIRNIEVDPANPKKFTVYFSKYYILAVETLCQTPIFPAYHYDPQNRLTDIPLTDMLDPEKAKNLAETNENLKKFAEEFQQAKYTTDPSGISGSGPYRPESIGNEQTVLVRKTNWWGDKLKGTNPLLAAYPAKIVYKVQKDEGILENMLRTGDLDVVLTMSPTRFLALQKDSFLAANYDFETRLSFQYNRWLFNLRNPKLADVKVRQALAHLVDYDYLLNTVQQGMGERLVSPINPIKPYYAKNIQPYQYNVQKARELLAEAGWTDTDNDGIVDKMINGRRTPLTIETIATTASPVTKQLAESIEQSARAGGVNIKIIPLDIQQLTEETKAGRFESALFGLGQYPGWNDFYQNYHSQSLSPAGDNRGAFANPEMDRLIEEIRSNPDEQKRTELYLQAQQILHDQVPEVFLYAPKQRYIGSKRHKHVFTSNRPGHYEGLFERK